ncbi:MAG TPA: hypothetical protein VM115_13400 [Vicinamibacterales bacterium]|nr:hypothetical protein [Vicinamibacterales bacterium]
MKSATLVTTLTTLTTAMAVVAPLVVFGFLYALQVHPARAAAVDARSRLEIAREELNRQGAFDSAPTVVEQVSALNEFAARTGQADGVEEAVDALTAVVDSPAVGRVFNVSIKTGAPEDVPAESTVRLFSQTMKQTPVTLTFDAGFEQIGRFFRNLRVLPTAFKLQSVELTPAAGLRAGLMRANVSLRVFHEIEAPTPLQVSAAKPVDVTTSPQWTRDPSAKAPPPRVSATPPPAEPDPVVTSILFSSGRRVAIVDGRIVSAGDRVRTGTIRAIEPGAVVIVDTAGRERRATIARPALRIGNR